MFKRLGVEVRRINSLAPLGLISKSYKSLGNGLTMKPKAPLTPNEANIERDYHRDLRFLLNGRYVVLTEVSPRTLLIDYLRSPDVGLTGTKLSCGEGGCGACTVVMAYWDSISDSVVERPINACLKLLCSVDGTAITTIEGIGNAKAPNVIQQRIAGFNGSQCGFCTPGFVMSMYSLLRRRNAPSAEAVENQFDGNLCRCTGFRPILDAMQSFVGDTEGIKKAVGSRYSRSAFGVPRKLFFEGAGDRWYRVLTIKDALALSATFPQGSVAFVSGRTSAGVYKTFQRWHDVLIDISQVSELKGCRIATNHQGIRIGAADTFEEVIEFLDQLDATPGAYNKTAVDCIRSQARSIAGHQVRSAATVGGTIMLALEHRTDVQPFPSDFVTILAALGAIVAFIQVDPPHAELACPILDLPTAKEFSMRHLITHVALPPIPSQNRVAVFKTARRTQNSHAIVNAAFQVGIGHGGIVADCCIVFGGIGGFAVRAKEAENALVGAPWTSAHFMKARRLLTEELSKALIPLPEDGMSDDFRLVLSDGLFFKFFVRIALAVAPSEVPARDKLAGFVLTRPISKGRHGTIAAPYRTADEASDATRVAAPAPSVAMPESQPRMYAMTLRRPDNIARRVAESLAVGATTAVAADSAADTTKIGALLQATGEARYTHDIFTVPGALATRFVLSKQSFAVFHYRIPLAELEGRLIKRFPGVRAYVSFADIPHAARSNTFDPNDPGKYDPVFANGLVTCCGQPIGLVVADTLEQAEVGAIFVHEQIAYSTEGLSAPLYTIEQAVASASFLKGNSLEQVERKGSDDQWFIGHSTTGEEISIEGAQVTGAQAHFYMETQATVAVPEEPGRVTLYASSQNLGSCQGNVANALGLQAASVEAKTVRLGGGFGGKEVRPPYFAVAAAVAAWKVRMPVRVALDRNTDMQIVGKRHPFKGKYILAADKSGRIGKIDFQFFANAGYSYDCTLAVTDLVLLSADGPYNIPTFRASRKACRTNLPTNTAMRSFGVIQTTLIVEDAIEHLAHELGMAPEKVREKNFYRDATLDEFDRTPYGQALTDCRIRQVWSDFQSIVDFDLRQAAITQFNAENRTRKRGLAMIPIKYGISFTSTSYNQGAAYVMVFGGDGTILIKHGGVEMGQGIHTKIARIAADTLGIDMALIQVSGSDTLDIPNAVSTGASTGTDLNGGAVLLACSELRERLRLFCQTNKKKVPSDWETNWQIRWAAVVLAANRERVNLAAQALFKSKDLGSLGPDGPLKDNERIFYYLTYSVAASEVEIDVLTGELSIIRADIVYDSGKTINAPLDHGQIEGGFVQGIGNVTTEQIYASDDGRLISDGTWNYKIPCSKTIPIEFNVYLLDYVPTPGARTPLDTYGVRSAKSTGEPPLVLASSVFFAIKRAILSARTDAGLLGWFELESPATIERIRMACGSAATDGSAPPLQ
jgi:xanthine dehydrogenase/oxidase